MRMTKKYQTENQTFFVAVGDVSLPALKGPEQHPRASALGIHHPAYPFES